jgi:hypothetical protein
MDLSRDGGCESRAAVDRKERNMSHPAIVVQGIVTADGTLELAERLTR